MDDLKLVKREYNNHDKKGITLINIVVLLFCILIVYGFNISNIVSKDRLNIGTVKNNINTTEQQNSDNTNTNNNNNSNNNIAPVVKTLTIDPPQPKRKRGRPKGSKNKIPGQLEMKQLLVTKDEYNNNIQEETIEEEN